MILKAENIYKSFKSGESTINVLNGTSIYVEKSDMVAIMGVSGSGKSTLLHILGLMDRPDSGKINIMGEDVQYGNEEWLAHKRNKNIGFVFQFYSLMNELNVIENVMLPAMIGDNFNAEKKAEELLADVGIERSMFKKKVYKLSGGEMQRVAFARALINSPDIIISDEPTANLDKQSSIGIVELMKRINEKYNQSFIIATHNKDVASQCKRILNLSKGMLII